MKKILLIALTVFAGIILVAGITTTVLFHGTSGLSALGNPEEKVQETVESIFENIQSNTQGNLEDSVKETSEYWESWNLEDATDPIGKKVNSIYAKARKEMTYEVEEVHVNDDDKQASVTVKVSYVDLNKTFDKWSEKMSSYRKKNVKKLGKLSKKEQKQIYAKLLTKIYEKNKKTVDQTIVCTLSKEGRNWVLTEDNEPFFDVALCGMTDSYKNVVTKNIPNMVTKKELKKIELEENTYVSDISINMSDEGDGGIDVGYKASFTIRVTGKGDYDKHVKVSVSNSSVASVTYISEPNSQGVTKATVKAKKKGKFSLIVTAVGKDRSGNSVSDTFSGLWVSEPYSYEEDEDYDVEDDSGDDYDYEENGEDYEE